MQDIHPIGSTGSSGDGGTFFAGEVDRRSKPHHHDLRCPRCQSINTKFCYYNNYNLSQPRHFCKSCRRYWTKGGVLRNVPVGGSNRKTKRSDKLKPKPSSKAVAVETTAPVKSITTPEIETWSSIFQWTETEVKMPEMRSSLTTDQTAVIDYASLENMTSNGELAGTVDEGLFDLTGTVDESYWYESRWSDDDGNDHDHFNYLRYA
ncbi:hypothetical protein L1987_23319 [Smallanthus sonchifolius]|uniref:Uncharacterized protein n=1 Tax=Smallanthus sonchifolius TaxID=185202 RepID=A0ACB9IHV5_9ASTR|nr:hypothetical protein L1987_23319 [Smallanthus sonchifolius]